MWTYGFHFSWIYNKEWNCGVIWGTLCEYFDGWHFEELPNCVQSGWHILNFHQQHVKAPISPYHHRHYPFDYRQPRGCPKSYSDCSWVVLHSVYIQPSQSPGLAVTPKRLFLVLCVKLLIALLFFSLLPVSWSYKSDP